jgi:ribonuclease HI
MKRALIQFDGGGQTPGPVKATCIVDLSDGSVIKDRKDFAEGTHNFAEYQALMLGLRVALKHGERNVLVQGDSSVVVNQVNGEWKIREPKLQPLRAEVCDLLAQFDDWSLEWIPRKLNRRADALGRT